MSCVPCKGTHHLERCHKFRAQNRQQRRDATKPTWYLPHHPVTYSQKPEKVRIVVDCVAKFRDTSLNDQLLQGPNYTNSLVGVLLRFRQERVAVMADIEKMFHQVNVKQEDRESLRFL